MKAGIFAQNINDKGPLKQDTGQEVHDSTEEISI